MLSYYPFSSLTNMVFVHSCSVGPWDGQLLSRETGSSTSGGRCWFSWWLWRNLIVISTCMLMYIIVYSTYVYTYVICLYNYIYTYTYVYCLTSVYVHIYIYTYSNWMFKNVEKCIYMCIDLSKGWKSMTLLMKHLEVSWGSLVSARYPTWTPAWQLVVVRASVSPMWDLSEGPFCAANVGQEYLGRAFTTAFCEANWTCFPNFFNDWNCWTLILCFKKSQPYFPNGRVNSKKR